MPLNEYEERAAKQVQDILRQCNWGSSLFRKMFVRALLEEHRQTQQDFTSAALQWLSACAQQQHFDARNKVAVELAREIMASNPKADCWTDK